MFLLVFLRTFKLCVVTSFGDIHWIDWAKFYWEMVDGGLGLCDLRIFRSTLLAKLVGREFLQPSSLWSQIVQAKYIRMMCGVI